MRRFIQSFLLTLTLSSFSLVGLSVAQESPTLTIGSKAPAIDIEHWVSLGNDAFKKVKSFEKDSVYVVEFWATWCGPCVASMPHLAETQTKYAGKKVQIISVSDEELDTVEKFLTRTVKSQGEGASDKKQTYGDLTSAYCLTCDPDGSVQESYMNAAGQNGIPCCFIVGKSGFIEWIGHPMEMDEPLSQIVENKWDRESFAAEFKKNQQLDLLEQKIARMTIPKASKAIEEARASFGDDETTKMRLDEMQFSLELRSIGPKVQKGDIDGAIAGLDELAKKMPARAEQIAGFKLNLLVQSKNVAGIKSLLDSADKIENPMLLNAMAWNTYEIILEDKDGSKDLIASALKVAEKAAKLAPESGAILDTLAHLLDVSGNLDRAIEVQTKAVECEDGKTDEVRDYLKELKGRKDKKK